MKKEKKPKESEWDIKITKKIIFNTGLLKGVTVIYYKQWAKLDAKVEKCAWQLLL